jgi:hypothetical protein
MGDVKKSAFLAVLATAIVTGRTFGGTFSDDFSTGLNPADWSIVNTDSSAYTVSAPGGNSGVTLANTGGVPSGPVQGVSIVLNLAALGGDITGDFSAQVDFSNWSVSPPTDSGDEEASLDTNYSNGGIWDVIRDEETGGVSNNAHIWEGFIPAAISTTATSGSFSITRTGGTLVGYFNGTEIDDETQVAPLSYLAFSIASQGGDSADTSTITFSNFSFTAASVPVPEPASIGALTLVATGILARRRRRTVV